MSAPSELPDEQLLDKVEAGIEWLILNGGEGQYYFWHCASVDPDRWPKSQAQDAITVGRYREWLKWYRLWLRLYAELERRHPDEAYGTVMQVVDNEAAPVLWGAS